LQAVALSPDATLAATCIYAPRYAEFKNAIQLWDAAAGKVKLDLGPTFKRGSEGVTGMGAAAFSRDGKVLALGHGGEVESGNGKVYLLSVPDGKKLHELPGHQNGVTCFAFHPDGKHLASGGRDTTVRLWSVADGKQVAQLGKGRGGQFQDWLHAVSFSADGRSLAAADMAGMIHVWTFPLPAGASHDAPDPRRPAVARAGR
jgi:WD40 repeat protein